MKIAAFIFKVVFLVNKNTYIFIDVEAALINGTQHIIEIGAIKLYPNGNVERFSRFIKPKNFKKLSSYIQKLTGITNEDILEGKSFQSVIYDFMNWCGEDSIFVSFGEFDRKILEMELERNHINKSFMYPIIDFQQKYMIEHNIKIQPSLVNLLTEFNIPIELHHRALSDAQSLMKLFQFLNGEALVEKQQTNDFILLLSEWRQHEECYECFITYVTGYISSKVKIQTVQSIQKPLPIKVVEDEKDQTTKQMIQPNIEIKKFLQNVLENMEHKVLITRANMKTISKICRIHQCALPKTEIVPLQTLLKDQKKLNQFLINDLKIEEYEQKVCHLIHQYSNNIKEEFSKRHLFKRDKVTLS